MDDHAAGDGRELVVTVNGLCTAEAVNCELAGADVSMFFSALPPGMAGTARAACGMGSGSMTMAFQVQGAVARGAPLLIIDEDRAAPNLLVRSCLQTGEVTPLSEILAHDRGKIGDTALVFAACAMDALSCTGRPDHGARPARGIRDRPRGVPAPGGGVAGEDGTGSGLSAACKGSFAWRCRPLCF